jgi:hypothetical protein
MKVLLPSICAEKIILRSTKLFLFISFRVIKECFRVGNEFIEDSRIFLGERK